MPFPFYRRAEQANEVSFTAHCETGSFSCVKKAVVPLSFSFISELHRHFDH